MSWVINHLDFPCKDCPDRYPGCSGKCEKYKQAREAYDKLKSADNARREANRYTARAITNNRDRTVKYKREYNRRRWSL